MGHKKTKRWEPTTMNNNNALHTPEQVYPQHKKLCIKAHLLIQKAVKIETTPVYSNMGRNDAMDRQQPAVKP